jgi:ABC-type multidrug transport system fused ATPase/permease subunit
VRRRNALIASLAFAAVVVISASALMRFPGNAAPFLVFDASYLLMLGLAFARPRVHLYTFLSAMLFLGFWTKFMAHMLVTYAFVEPVGRFNGSASDWNSALWSASVAAVGLSLARFAYLLARRRTLDRSPSLTIDLIPTWYREYRGTCWSTLLLSSLALFLLNWRFDVYKIGVIEKLVLPLHLNAVAAWLISLGIPMVVALLADWELTLAPNAAAPLAGVAIEALGATVSMLSRSAYLFRVVPFGLALWVRERQSGVSRFWKAFVSIAVSGFALGLVIVSALRVTAYTPAPKVPTPAINPLPQGSEQSAKATPDGAAPQTPSVKVSRRDAARWAIIEVIKLPIDRWVGLEGVLSVTASGYADWQFFRRAIREDPRAGTEALYQTMARSQYRQSSEFVFLTLPGLVAVLAYSGSLWFIGVAAFAIGLVSMCIEEIISLGLQSSFLCAVIGANAAYRIAQLTYPYLLGIFVLELIVQCTMMWLLVRIAIAPPQTPP